MNPLGPMPRLETERLILRPFCLYDAKSYLRLAIADEVLYGTDMPHDLSEDAVKEWIISHPELWQQRWELFLLATDKKTRETIGAVSLFTYSQHKMADLGFWIAHDKWGQGYATEVCKEVLKYAFEQMKLNRLQANHMVRNPASGRVLEKLGFKYEGLHKEAYVKDGEFVDLKFYSLLSSDYFKNKK